MQPKCSSDVTEFAFDSLFIHDLPIFSGFRTTKLFLPTIFRLMRTEVPSSLDTWHPHRHDPDPVHRTSECYDLTISSNLMSSHDAATSQSLKRSAETLAVDSERIHFCSSSKIRSGSLPSSESRSQLKRATLGLFLKPRNVYVHAFPTAWTCATNPPYTYLIEGPRLSARVSLPKQEDPYGNQVDCGEATKCPH